MAIPSSSARSCRCSFQVLDRLLLLPPESAQIRILFTPLLAFAPGQFPPPPNAFHRELRRVMRHADVDHCPVFSDFVRPVWNRLSLGHGREIMFVHSVWFALGPPCPTPVFEGSN